MRLRPPFAEYARRREREMVLGGVTQSTAHIFALTESKGRQRAAEHWGDEKALAARLEWRDEPDEGIRWFLVLPVVQASL